MSVTLPPTLEVDTIAPEGYSNRDKETTNSANGDRARSITHGLLTGVAVGGLLTSGVAAQDTHESDFPSPPEPIVTLHPGGLPPTPQEAAILPPPKTSISGAEEIDTVQTAVQEINSLNSSELPYYEKLRTVIHFQNAFNILADKSSANSEYYKGLVESLNSTEDLDYTFNVLSTAMLSFKEASVTFIPDEDNNPQHAVLDLINRIIISKADSSGSRDVAEALIKDEGYYFTYLRNLSPSEDDDSGKKALGQKLNETLLNEFYEPNPNNPNELIPVEYNLSVLAKHIELARLHMDLLEEYYKTGSSPYWYQGMEFGIIIDPKHDSDSQDVRDKQANIIRGNGYELYGFRTISGDLWYLGGKGQPDDTLVQHQIQ